MGGGSADRFIAVSRYAVGTRYVPRVFICEMISPVSIEAVPDPGWTPALTAARMPSEPWAWRGDLHAVPLRFVHHRLHLLVRELLRATVASNDSRRPSRRS